MRNHIDKVYGESFIKTFHHRDIGFTNGFVRVAEPGDEQGGKIEEDEQDIPARQKRCPPQASTAAQKKMSQAKQKRTVRKAEMTPSLHR